MSSQTRRVAFTLPAGLAASLGYVALRLGTTKSELLASLISEPLEQMRSVLFAVPTPLNALTPEERAAVFAGYSQMLEKALADGAKLSESIGERASNG